MLGHEPRDRAGRQIHDEAGDDDRRDHDLEILRHADRGDDGIQREHHIDDDDLDDHPEKRARAWRVIVLFVARFHLGMNFVGRLADQKQPAADQDDVAP